MSAAVTLVACPEQLVEVLGRCGVQAVACDAPPASATTPVVVSGPGALPVGPVARHALRRAGNQLVAWAPGAAPGHVYELLRAGAMQVVVGDWPTIVPVVLRLLDAPASYAAAVVGHSRAMLELQRTACEIAPTADRVVIVGETGTGKELLARTLYLVSGRSGPLVPVDCAAASGVAAVEGALSGLLMRSDGGTLLLDEPTRLPGAAQLALLRALDVGRVRLPGALDEAAVDVHVVATSREPLEQAEAGGRLRPELRHRLDVVRLNLPPLRRRTEDIPYLVARFMHDHAQRHRRPEPELSPEFIAALVARPWPGNVRELRNVVERVVLTRGRARLEARDAEELLAPAPAEEAPAAALEPVDPAASFEQWLAPRVAALERRYLEEVLRRSGWSMRKAAAAAGIARRTLARKMRALGLPRREEADG